MSMRPAGGYSAEQLAALRDSNPRVQAARLARDAARFARGERPKEAPAPLAPQREPTEQAAAVGWTGSREAACAALAARRVAVERAQ